MIKKLNIALVAGLLLMTAVVSQSAKAGSDAELMSQDWRTALPAELPLSNQETASLTKY